jgi:hypothetical protein
MVYARDLAIGFDRSLAGLVVQPAKTAKVHPARSSSRSCVAPSIALAMTLADRDDMFSLSTIAAKRAKAGP